MKYHVLVPYWNCADYIGDTVHNLRYTINDREDVIVHFLDDASDAATQKRFSEALDLVEFEYTYDRNKENLGTLLNLYNGALKYGDPMDVMIQVDGDGDVLWFSDYFEFMDMCFRDEIWAVGGLSVNSKNVIEFGTYSTEFTRREGWCCFHPRTWRHFLMEKIPKKSIIDPRTKEYYRLGSDCFLYWPILEMCGPDRIVYLNTVLYQRNTLNPLNVGKSGNDRYIRDTLLARLEKERPFNRLKSPFDKPRRSMKKRVYTWTHDNIETKMRIN